MREQEIIQTLLFKPFYDSSDLPIHNSEADNEILKVIIIKFRELDQLDQFDQWANREMYRQ
ncbi:35904_t:CDS:2 [Gigaspora margarita]|uniref:35904_t:CDS:1 n=1 Tax=Gigaspora margarita TaxID=4874 RepID=A0ABN7V1A5_GIGMA|nr:35904_t:CDS:2 [Gigaspora margarita]